MKKKKNLNNFALWGALGLLMMGVLYSISGGALTGKKPSTIAFSQMLQEAKRGRIASVDIQQNYITGKYKTGGEFESYAPENTEYVDALNENNVVITAQPRGRVRGLLLGMLISWSPFLILIALWFFFMKQMQGGGGGVMGFGQSRAKLLKQNRKKVTFKDVAGVDEACEELREVVDFLKDPKKFARLGGHIPRGVLLVGGPGTGKTLMARAVAGEADAPFFFVSGSDFVEMFVGVGASRVRDMFKQARKEKPCIVFVDEIDAVGRHRGAGVGGGNDEREQTLNQLLVEMDGFHPHEGIIVIAATNRPDVLDPALLRPGRFDRQIVVPLPPVNGREEILKIHIKNRKTPLASDVNLKTLARGTPGFSGADLENLVNESAIMATRKDQRLVTMEDFETAKDKVMMGSERRSLSMTEDDKKLTAYHESGHAIVALHLPASDKIHKATIIPRGRALGMVVRLPERDPISISRAKMKADLCVAMGGRVAEEMIFGYDKVTSGASSDIKAATSIARNMVTHYGMSEKLGPLSYGENEDEVFLGHSVTKKQNLSEKTQRVVDQEIYLLVQESYEGAKVILKKYEKELHSLAKALLRYETLDLEEIKIILKKGKLPEDDQSTPKSIFFPHGKKPDQPSQKSVKKPEIPSIGKPQIA